MAKFWSQRLYQARFLLVAALALAVLSTPLVTEAGSRKISSVEVIEIENTVAGLSGHFTVQGEAYAYMEALVTKPSGKELLLESVSDGRGTATFSISNEQLQRAGTYEVQAKHAGKNESYGATESFEVYPGTFSSSKSTWSSSKRTAQVGETIEVIAKVKDDYGNPLKGHVLKLSASQNNARIYSTDFASNEKGESHFYIEGQSAGITELRLLDTSANQNFEESIKLAFLTADSNTQLNVGGFDDAFVELSAESGPISGFRISSNDNQVVGKDFTATVTAIDANGLTVTDYTGTIRFSSTDSGAKLPNDYSFLAEDLGEHRFSLSFKFVTPGEQLLSVNDINTFQLSGEKTLEISSSDNSVDLGNDFVTNDFEREGDFALISPASGSYSVDSIKIQGEADYGYHAITYLNEVEMDRTEIEFDNRFEVNLMDLPDGNYELYVDIVELSNADTLEEAEILEVIETSDVEKIVIDTTAPKIVNLSSSPNQGFMPGDTVRITLLSESGLEEANLLFQNELTPLQETSTAGKYEAEITLPTGAGNYTLDLILSDPLGNEVQYRDQLSFILEESVAPEPEIPALGAVTGVTLSAGEESIILSWEAAEGEAIVDHYLIKYGPSPETLFAVTESFDASTSWSILGLSGGQNYAFAIQAVDKNGNLGPQSNVVQGMPLAKSTPDPEMFRPETETKPAIAENEMPPSQPDSGPELLLLLLISVLGSGAALLFAPQKV